jgi:hypothetical protein
MNLSALKALQARIRQATGPDRELDGRIGFVFGLGYSKNYRECECCESHVIGKDGSKLTYSSLAYWQTSPQWTGSLDACVALMMEVLPGWTRVVDASAPELGIDVSLSYPESDVGYWIKEEHALETHATLLAIIAAYISELEATQTEKTG